MSKERYVTDDQDEYASEEASTLWNGCDPDLPSDDGCGDSESPPWEEASCPPDELPGTPMNLSSIDSRTAEVKLDYRDQVINRLTKQRQENPIDRSQFSDLLAPGEVYVEPTMTDERWDELADKLREATRSRTNEIFPVLNTDDVT